MPRANLLSPGNGGGSDMFGEKSGGSGLVVCVCMGSPANWVIEAVVSTARTARAPVLGNNTLVHWILRPFKLIRNAEEGSI